MTIKDIQDKNLLIGKIVLMPKKSIELMLKSVPEGEEIHAITPCNSGNTPGVVTITNKRLIFSSKVLFNSLFKEFDLKNITSVTLQSSYGNKMTITSFGEVFVIDAIDKAAAEKIIQRFNMLKSA